jgi:hypothetical protein
MTNTTNTKKTTTPTLATKDSASMSIAAAETPSQAKEAGAGILATTTAASLNALWNKSRDLSTTEMERREAGNDFDKMALAQFDPEMVAKSMRLRKAIRSLNQTAVQDVMNAGADPSVPFAVVCGKFCTPWTQAIEGNFGSMFLDLLGRDRTKVPLAISGHFLKTVFEVMAQNFDRIDIREQISYLMDWMFDSEAVSVKPTYWRDYDLGSSLPWSREALMLDSSLPWRREELYSMQSIMLENIKKVDGQNELWNDEYSMVMGAGGIPDSGPAILEYLSVPSFYKDTDGFRISRFESLLWSDYGYEIVMQFLSAGLSPNAILDGKPMIYHAAKANKMSPVVALLDAGAIVSNEVAAICATLPMSSEIGNLIHATAAKHAINEVLASVRSNTACFGIAK